MADAMIDAVSDEEILYSNSLGAVTRNWIIIPDSSGRSRTMIPISLLSQFTANKVSYPGLLVVAAGLLVLAAASFSSKEGSGAGIPIALVAIVSLIAYRISRKASVAFTTGSAVTNTIAGSHNDADGLALAVELAQADLLRGAREDSELASYTASASM